MYAFSEMVGRAETVMGFYAIFGRGQLSMVECEDCASPFSHPASRSVATENYLSSHLLALQDMLRRGVFSNVSCIRGPPNPAGGLTQHRPDLVFL